MILIHVVGPGENLYKISQRYQVPIDRIIEDNGLQDPNLLLIGEALIIRKENETYTVVRGDTLTGIAARFGIPLEALYKANDLSSTSVIYPGDVLRIVHEDFEKRKRKLTAMFIRKRNTRFWKECFGTHLFEHLCLPRARGRSLRNR